MPATKTPKKTGRPKKPEEEARSEQLHMRITQQERALLNSVSAREGCTNTEAIIKALRFYNESSSGENSITVSFPISDSQLEKLEALATDYSKTFGEITTPELFRMMMITGSAHEIDQRIETYKRLLQQTAQKKA